MSTIIVCAFVVVIAGLVCEFRLMRADKEKLKLHAKLNEAKAIGMDLIGTSKALYYVLEDKLPDEDINQLVKDKKTEMEFEKMMEELENGKH